MTRIEECEKLFADWKAKAETSISYKLIESAKRQANTAHGIALALEIFKRPSNTQLKIDGPVACPLYTDYKKSCQALKDHDAELRRTT